MRRDILDRESEIRQWVADEWSKASMCVELSCRPDTLNRWLDKMGIEYAGNQGARGRKQAPNRLSALEYVEKHGPLCSSLKLKWKLIEDGIQEHQCAICGITEWCGAPTPIDLHHKDGNRFNNNFDNVQIVCPNCHAQTKTFRGKNAGSGYMPE